MLAGCRDAMSFVTRIFPIVERNDRDGDASYRTNKAILQVYGVMQQVVAKDVAAVAACRRFMICLTEPTSDNLSKAHWQSQSQTARKPCGCRVPRVWPVLVGPCENRNFRLYWATPACAICRDRSSISRIASS